MTLVELLGLLRKHIKLVIALPVICAVFAAAVSWGFLANTYTASTSLYILTKSQSSSGSTGTSSSDLSTSQMIANDLATLINSGRIKNDAAKELGLDSLSGYTISVENSTTTRVITLKVQGKDPEVAAQIANQLGDSISEAAQSIMDLQAVNVIDQASVPTSPSGPNRILYTGGAFVVGLVLAIVIVVLMDMINTRVRDEYEIAEITGLTIIGRIPTMKDVR